MLITIQREENSPFETVDDSFLIRTDGEVDNDDEHTTWVEYRFPNHPRIVHRSVNVTLKKWPAGMEAVQGILG